MLRNRTLQSAPYRSFGSFHVPATNLSPNAYLLLSEHGNDW